MPITELDSTTFKDTIGNSTIKIGGDTAAFEPKVEIGRFSDECKVRISVPTLETVTPAKADDKVSWADSTKGVEIYKTDNPRFEDGSLEINITLYSKPKDYKVILDVESDNLVWTKQPPLTQAQIDEDRFRPPEAVNSYAVYHSSKKNNQYKTGKAFHVLRNVETVDDMDYADGKLTFLLNKKVMDAWDWSKPMPHATGATFGRTSQGASTFAIRGAAALIEVSPASDGNATSITAWLRVVTAAKYGRCAIYEQDDGNSEWDKVEEAAGIDVSPGDDQEQAFPLDTSPAILAAKTYALIVNGEYDASSNIRVYYDAAADKTGWHDNGFSYAGAWGASILYNTFVSDEDDYSIYCTYTESGGTAYDKDISLSLGLQISAARTAAYSRAASKSLGLAISVARQVVRAPRSAALSLGLQISTSRTAAYSRSIAQSLGLQISAARTAAYTRTASVSLGLIGVLTKAYTKITAGLHRTPSFTVSLPDDMLTVAAPDDTLAVSMHDTIIETQVN